MTHGDARPAWLVVSRIMPQPAPPSWPTSVPEVQRLAFLHPRACAEGSLVAEIEGKVGGCLVFHNYREEGNAVICLVAVAPEFQRLGTGRALMTAAEANARALGLRRFVAPETPEEGTEFFAFAEKFGMRRAGTITSYFVDSAAFPPMPEDEHVVPAVNCPLSELTNAFNECFPRMPRNQDDLHALITQSRWGPWASLAYVEGPRILGFLFTTDRGGRPYFQHVGTRAEVRRRGLALTLVKHALHILHAGGAREVECEVTDDNPQGAKLAEALGMKPGARRVAYVKDLG
jgi:ribosomal protein S18 acetylase RimI-like enzyme